MRHLIYLFSVMLLISSCESKTKKAKAHIENAVEKIYLAQHKEALSELEKAVQLDSGLYEAYYYRASCKRNLQDIDGAIVDFNKTIEINPAFAEAYLNLALIYDYQNDREKACIYYLKAEELGMPNLTDYTKHCK